MKRQSLFVWGISVLSILILAALILVNKQQTFSFLASQDAHKKELTLINQPTDVLAIETAEASTELLTFPLEQEALAQFFTDTTDMYINASSLNLRAGPSTAFDIVKTLFMNDAVTVGATVTFDQFDYSDDEVEWVAIQSDEAFGFVNPNYLSEEPAESTEEPATEDTTAPSNEATDASSTNKKPNTSESSSSPTNEDPSSSETTTSENDKVDDEPTTEENSTDEKEEKPPETDVDEPTENQPVIDENITDENTNTEENDNDEVVDTETKTDSTNE